MTLTIVVVLVLGGVLLAWRGYNSRRDDALEDFGNGAPAAADVAVRFFTERLTLLNSIAESEAVRSGDVEMIRAELAPFATPELGLDDLGFVDEDGILQVDPPIDVSDRSYVRTVERTGEPFVSEAIVGRVTDQPLVVLAVPASHADGTRLGTLVATVHVDNAAEMIPTEPGDRLQIVDSAGNLIYDGGPVSELLPPRDPTALAVPEGDAEAAPGLGGQADQIVAQAGVDNAGWQIVLARTESSVGKTARDAFIRELVLLGVVGALALLGAWWVSRRIDRLHRAEVGHAGEMAALEQFSAALAAADSPAAVAEAVGTHGPEVLGTQDDETADTSDAHRQSLVTLMNEQTAVALERARNTAEVEHLAYPRKRALLGHHHRRGHCCDPHSRRGRRRRLRGAGVGPRHRAQHPTHLRSGSRRPASGLCDRGPDPVAHPQAEAIRIGEIVSAADADELRARFPDWAESAMETGIVAAVAAPFVLGNEPVQGAMALAFDRDRRLDTRERALLSTVSRFGADALTRAQRFGQEQRVAETLQASLQPERLPQMAGWRFSGIILAGEAGISVGGDWYDVAVLPHGVILLSVGDVTGRGPVAAGVMGLVRAAVRALALSDPDPASILEHTDDLLRGSTVHQLATAWVGLLDPATGQLRFASRRRTSRRSCSAQTADGSSTTRPGCCSGPGCPGPDARRSTRSSPTRRSSPTPTGCASGAASRSRSGSSGWPSRSATASGSTRRRSSGGWSAGRRPTTSRSSSPPGCRRRSSTVPTSRSPRCG